MCKQSIVCKNASFQQPKQVTVVMEKMQYEKGKSFPKTVFQLQQTVSQWGPEMGAISLYSIPCDRFSSMIFSITFSIRISLILIDVNSSGCIHAV